MKRRTRAIARKKDKKKEARINRGIRALQLRVIDSDGKQLGVITTEEALGISESKDLDLVEVAPEATPPVCKIMDYGKYKYQMEKKLHLAKKKSRSGKLKEIKFRPKTEEHDYQFKLKHILKFIGEGNKVKITVMFRGREMSYTDKGMEILDRLTEDLVEEINVEAKPKMESRNMYMILTPKKR